MNQELLSVCDVRGGYGAVRVLKGVSLGVAKGSITALIGGNGAGKTTLMNIIAGVLPMESGSIALGGSELGALMACDRVERGVALVPEGRLIFPQLTVYENLRLGAISPRAREGFAERRERVLELFPLLRERHGQYGGTLSGGEQQMLALGRGLMANPELLLLDEPTLGLAPIIAKSIFETIRRLRDSGITIFISEQDTRRTLALADVAYVLENGEVVLSGSGGDLMKDLKVKQAYLGM